MSLYVQLETTRTYRRWPWFWIKDYRIEPIDVPRQAWHHGMSIYWDEPLPVATITHVSVWDNPVGGWCLFDRIPMTVSVPILDGGTFTLTELDITLTRI